MTKRRRLIEESDSEEYLHKATWEVVMRQLAHAESNPKGALYDDLAAMVFAYYSMEGYLNFVGEKIEPQTWKDEMKAFSKTGIMGKLSKICELCQIKVPERGARPYGTIFQLKQLRDRIAHPKTRRASKKIEFVDDKPPPLFPKLYLETLVDHQKALRARDDVKCIADEIHSAETRLFPHVMLGPCALGGIQSMRTSATRLL